MPITINGQPHADGAPLTIGGVQAQEVTVNGVSVWKNTIPPSAITNLAASSNRVGQILVTFTHSVGLPTPQHDLYISGGLVASDIASGYVHTIAGGDYSNIFIRAHNVAGTINSNTASGRSQVAAGSQTFNSNTNWTVPAGVKTATVCACGGGGGGGNTSGGLRGGGGGGSGTTASVTAVVLTPGAIINVGIGAGGIAGITAGPGGTTTLSGAGINVTVTRVGGIGAIGATQGAGVNGGGAGAPGDPWVVSGSSSGCGGSYPGVNKGDNSYGGSGGSGGYGIGGADGFTHVLPNTGGGGFGTHINANDWTASNGGSGRAVISWAQH